MGHLRSFNYSLGWKTPKLDFSLSVVQNSELVQRLQVFLRELYSWFRYIYVHADTFGTLLNYSSSGLSIFFKSTGQYFIIYRRYFFFYKNLNNYHEYLIHVQHSLKSGGTKDRFKRIKVLGTAPYWKGW